MWSAGNGRRKLNDPSADVEAETAVHRTDENAFDASPSDPPAANPSIDEPVSQGYVGALRQHESKSNSSRELIHSGLPQSTGYEGSIRAAATFGATKVGEDKNPNLMAVVVLSSILGLVACIITLSIVAVFAGRV